MSSFFNVFFSSPFSKFFFLFSPIWSFHLYFSHMHYSLPIHVFKPLYRLSLSLCPLQHSFFCFPSCPVLSFLPFAILGWLFPDASPPLGFRVLPHQPASSHLRPAASFRIQRLCHIHENPRTHGIIWGWEGPQEVPCRVPLPGQLSRGQYSVSASRRGPTISPQEHVSLLSGARAR